MSFAHGCSSYPIYKKWLPFEFMYHIQAICKLPMLSYYNVNLIYKVTSACVRPSVWQDNSAIENAEPASAFSMVEPGNAQTVTYPILYRFSQSLLTQVQFTIFTDRSRSVRLSRSWNPMSVYWGPESATNTPLWMDGLKNGKTGVVCLHGWQGTRVTLGPETRGPETQVLRARHGPFATYYPLP
jgi:hypothetical protein